ncbi:Cytochrome c biogenesis factor [Pseudomonas syringae pv. actinidiae]|uniref:Cytochrome c biogenesis factor n=1 Tax=Pseudomonas syringae pv. actinidiae TaxID=103796 RepID=A0A2V0QFP2_PSESF|nr:Cytochrome c biogenesis factor [Pseudomonas syringae pv. actinidiae]
MRRHTIKQAATHKEALFVPGNLKVPTVHHQSSARLHAIGNITTDLIAMLTGNQRPHVQAAGGARTDLEALDLWNQFSHQRIGNLITDADRDRDRHATLTAGSISRAHQSTDGVVQVGIRHQHSMILGPAQRLNTLAPRCALFIDVLGNGCRTHETQRLDLWRFDQRINRDLVAMHHIQHALRQPGFV